MNPPPNVAPRPIDYNDRPSSAPVKSIDRLPAATPEDSGAPSPERPDPLRMANGVTMASAAAFRAPTTVEAAAPPRREVLNAMRALREMPPYAREREIEKGRYSRFTPEERELLRNADK